MGGKIDVYNWGQLGVDVVRSPIHIHDGSWRQLQNGEFSDDEGRGGVKKRGSLTRINSSALAGAVKGMTGVPLPLLGDPALLIALNKNVAGNSWRKSPDGSAFTTIATADLQRAEAMATVSTLGAVLNASNFFINQRMAPVGNRIFFAGDDYIMYNPPTLSPTPPPVVQWDGTTEIEAFRVPTNPTSPAGSYPYWISDMLAADGFVYITVYDPGTGSAVDHKGRVLRFDPVNGGLDEIGNRFGDDTGENLAGFPHCICSYIGNLFVGTNTIGGGTSPRVYRIIPGGEESWTNDVCGAATGGGAVSMAVYNGKLYVGFATNDAGNAVVRERTSDGTWTASLTVAGNPSFFGGLIAFDDVLLACHFHGGTACTIRRYNGSAWATDKNVGTDINNTHSPGTPWIFQDNLYWPFFAPTSDVGATGFLLKRDTSGTWTTVFSGVGLRGIAGVFYPDA